MDEIMQMLAALPPETRLETVEQAFADKARFDKLQALTEKQAYTGTVIMRMSSTDRGWRLHETSQDGADSDVRGAIDRFFAEFDPEGEVLDD
jgi:hypothetical protein